MRQRQALPDYNALKAKVQRLAEGPADIASIKTRLKKLAETGIPVKPLRCEQIIVQKRRILERLQERAEGYEFLGHNCAKGSALAVMEEFGIGNMTVITALSSVPGVAAYGEVCGAVTGGLIAIGLFFGSEDLLDYDANTRAMEQSRRFKTLFEKELGSINCREIQETIVFGRWMDARASLENRQAFLREKGYEKCALPTGVGARLAAQVIIESLERDR